MKDPFSYVFLLKIKVFFQVEKKIATDAQNLAKHYKKKWDKILLCLLSVDRD